MANNQNDATLDSFIEELKESGIITNDKIDAKKMSMAQTSKLLSLISNATNNEEAVAPYLADFSNNANMFIGSQINIQLNVNASTKKKSKKAKNANATSTSQPMEEFKFEDLFKDYNMSYDEIMNFVSKKSTTKILEKIKF